jgi:hypothetical protein
MFLANVIYNCGTPILNGQPAGLAMGNDSPVQVKSSQARLTGHYSQVRIAKRRAHHSTADFKNKYRMQGGIVVTNNQLARSE